MTKSGSELGWALESEIGLSVGMVLEETVGYTIVYSIIMLVGFVLGNYFGTWEGYLVSFSLGTLSGLIIGTVEGYLVGLSLILPLGSSLESTNYGNDIYGILLGMPLRLWFGSESLRCVCFCCHLTGSCESNFWGVGISCVPPYGDIITYNTNLVSF